MEIQKPQPAYQQVYDYLFKQIIEGDLPPGIKLSEERLAAELNISRTPIREAIIRLEHEGLLRNKSVVQFTPKEIKDSYEIRILLEGHAAKVAATQMSQQDKDFLRTLTESSHTADFETVMKTNTLFHNTIVRSCGNDQITQLIDRMQSIILLCRKDIVKNRAELPHEHHEIYEAILRGDGEAAEQLMQAHLQQNLQNFLDNLPDDSRL
ncbi:GntR family transcriptional regulator [Alicyclobacillus acidoterrestris]|uniref:GntR family transcriptional regulator n=1 Tax=Alicyclobacillus TaxID=29330 RepID=UPI00118F1CEF|nr:GntR family transcriptional regulator [Alicyclobacillus suci]GEO24638.1 GntR family transcriptional regulator [Alicyclobacillus acidoterrestris]